MRGMSLGTGVVAAAVGLACVACATNPVSGKREFVLMSEAQEIALGRQSDQEVIASYGLYPDEKLQQYVQALGARLAAASERPHLPWTFRVVDDAAVNAFALPGGFVYVTRGILAHFNSEAELVAVMGHEIGHVAARHSVSQVSRQQLAQVGLAAGMILSSKVAQFGGLAQTGLGLMFLSFGRADESEADRLGLKYMLAGGYDPREMVDVFRMLEGVSRQSGGGRLPQWMSSHPDPENRQAWASTAVAGLDRDLGGLTVNRPGYLQYLDGLVFGENPREGIFEGTTFRHPDLAFRVTFPAGWKTSNEKQAVGAVSAEQDAIVIMRLSAARSANEAARQFFSQEGLEAGEEWRREIGGFPAASATFRAASEQAILQGLAAWVEYGGRVYQFLGYTTEQRWPQRGRAIAQSIASFQRETDAAVLRVEPYRLSLVELRRSATFDQLVRDYPSTVSPEIVSLINDLGGQTLRPAGDAFKRVIGGPARR